MAIRVHFALSVIACLIALGWSFHLPKSPCNIGRMSMSLSDHKEELVRTATRLSTPGLMLSEFHACFEEITLLHSYIPPMALGKGILAADESITTIGKRFHTVDVENSVQNRQAYRGMLFSTPNLGQYVSGTILHEESLFQSSKEDVPFVDLLKEGGIIPGIKVDMGLQQLHGADSIETWATGLDGLPERAASYYTQGARFAKWRAVLQITDSGCPSRIAIQENAWGLARYARVVQDAGLVPIVEPEILMDGAHSIARTAEVQEEVLLAVYRALRENGVLLEGSLLKPSMTCPGALNFDPMTKEEVAEYTLRTLRRCVPAAVPGIAFLSGGLSEEHATQYLNAINSLSSHAQAPEKGLQEQGQKDMQALGAAPTHNAPWTLTFSYGRALQQSCLRAWAGLEANAPAAQTALLARAKANAEASLGQYVALSQPSANESLFVNGYKY